MFLSKLLKRTQGKLMIALAGLTMVFGVGAAVLLPAFDGQIMTADASSGDFEGVYVYSNEGSWGNTVSLADDGAYWRGFASLSAGTAFKLKGHYSDGTDDWAGYRDTLNSTYFENGETQYWGGGNIKVKSDKSGIYYFKVNGNNFHNWGKDDAAGGKSAIWWNGDATITAIEAPILRGTINNVNYWSSDALKFTANNSSQTFTYTTVLHENDEIKVYYPSGADDARKWIGYHTDLSSTYFIGRKNDQDSSEIGTNIRIKKTGTYTFTIGTNMITYDNNSYLWQTSSDSSIAFADLQTTITFDRQSGTGGTGSATVTYGSNMSTITAPTRTGYTFGGYYTATDGGGTKYYNANGTYAKAWDIEDPTKTLYAKWTINSHTLTWNFNGGTPSGSYTAGGSVAYGTTITYPTTVTKTGYTFSSWSTSVTTMPDSNLTITANFTAMKITITLNNASATTAGTTAIYEKYADGFYLDSACTSKKMSTSANQITTPTKTGYTFGGYYTESGGTGTKVIDAAGYLVSDTSTTLFLAAGNLYAKWSVNSHTLTWDFDGGTPTGTYTTGGTVAYGATITYPSAMTKTGYTFSSWSSDHATMPDNDLTITALYTAMTFTISYNANGGSGSAMSTSTLTYDSGFTLRTNTYTTPGNGYGDFVSWNTAADGTGTNYESNVLSASDVNDLFSSGDRTLYAIWECGKDAALSYAATFNSTIGGICKNDGSTVRKTLEDAWAAQDGAFDALEEYEQYWLLNSRLTGETVGDAFYAKYNWVVAVHGEGATNWNINDFLGRKPTPRPAGVIAGMPSGQESPLTTTLWIVLASGIVGLGAIGAAYFVSKKRKRA